MKEAESGLAGTWVVKEAESLASIPNASSTLALCANGALAHKELDPEKAAKDPPCAWRKYAGILFTLTASLFFSAGVLVVKVLNGPDYGFHSYSATFWRYLGVALPSIPLLLYYECGRAKQDQPSVFTSVWPLTQRDKWWTVCGLLSRGLLGGSSVILRYYALQYLTIGDTAVITYSTPVLVTILAHFFLKEKCGVVPVLVAIITFFGVVIITRPPFLTGAESFNTDTLIGTGLACGSLVCSALIVVITRKIRDVHFSLMTLVFGILGVVQAGIFIVAFGDFQYPSLLEDTVFILVLAVTSFLGQMAIILALKFEQAGPVSLLRSCDVLFGFLLQFIFLGVAPDLLSSLGGTIVLACVSLTGIRKWLSLLPEENQTRRRFRFLLV